MNPFKLFIDVKGKKVNPRPRTCLVREGKGLERTPRKKTGTRTGQCRRSFFVTHVKYMTHKNLWRNDEDNLVTKVTPEESIQMFCVTITSDTKDCPNCHVTLENDHHWPQLAHVWFSNEKGKVLSLDYYDEEKRQMRNWNKHSVCSG